MEKKVSLSLRIGIIALIVSLLSMVGVSGTFAKYASSGSGVNESARVAQWGLTFSSGDETLFKTEYKATGDVIIAKSSGSMNIAAPGLSGSKNLLGSVSGTPEVAYKLNATVATAKYENIPTTGDAANYRPLKFTVSDGSTTKDITVTDNDFSSALQTALNDLLNTTYRPGGGSTAPTITLAWSWPFTDTGQDAKDTALGNAASSAGTEAAAPKVTFDISVTATQVNN